MELTREDIERGLRDLGLCEGDTVEVHSSLSSLGFVQGGASTIVDALMNVVGKNGALVMSNYPLSRPLPVTPEERAKGIAWKLRKLPEDSHERTVTGAISDNFRWRPDVVCGTDIHRICAWGRDAELHAKGYRHLVDVMDGWVLLIGVDHDRCSSLHLAERVEITEEAHNRMRETWGWSAEVKISDEVMREYPSDIILGPGVEGHASGDPWSNAWNEAIRRSLVKSSKIGNAQCLLFKAKAVVFLLEEIRCHGPIQPPNRKSR